MNYTKQVNSSHYKFFSYMEYGRWCSLWHQINNINKYQNKKILEVGPGGGVVTKVLKDSGVNIQTIDIDPDLDTDYIGSVTDLPFESGSFDVVVAYQVLEHLPYEKSLKAFEQLIRVCRQAVIISLPDVTLGVRCMLNNYNIHASINLFPKVHRYDGQHYWEIGKKGFSLKKVCSDFEKMAKLKNSYRVFEYPYHRYFIFTPMQTQVFEGN